jgi:SAM-dependent methyltransferase
MTGGGEWALNHMGFVKRIIPRRIKAHARELIGVTDLRESIALLGARIDRRMEGLEKQIAEIRIYLRSLESAVMKHKKAPDGLPIPPLEYMYLVVGNSDVDSFLSVGKVGAQNIIAILEKNSIDCRRFKAVLDFGCGCGRIIRHIRALLSAQLYGVDYNPRLIEWCTQHMPFARFETNQLYPPLRYEDATFDFIYALSVVTHLPEIHQTLWMKELFRLLKEGGYLLVSVHGDEFVQFLTEEERKLYLMGRMVIKNCSEAGTNRCGVYHPESYVRTVLSKGFDIIDCVPRGAEACGNQDLYLLRKPFPAVCPRGA